MLISEKNWIRYFAEVDLDYPDELHELHNDYMLAPEKLPVSSDDVKVGDVKKLIPNLANKTN